MHHVLSWKNALEELITAIENDDDIHFQNIATLPARTPEGHFGLDAITVHGPYLIGRIIEANKFTFFKTFIGNGKRWDDYHIRYPNDEDRRSIGMKSFIIWYVGQIDRPEMKSYLETHTDWLI